MATVYKGPNNKSSVINWKTTSNRNQSSIFATEFTVETKRTAIYLVSDSFAGLGGERTLVAYQDPNKPITLTTEGKNYDTNLQKVITTDPNFKKMVTDQTRYHVTNGLTLTNPDGSIGSRPSKVEIDRVLGLANPPAQLAQSTDPVQSPPPLSGPNPLTPGLNPDPNFNLSTIQTGGVVGSSKPNEKFEKILKYPLYESRGYDYLKINILEYVSSGIPQLSTGNLNTIDVEERFRETSILGTIFLPMQPGISDSASSSWNEDNLNPVQAAIGGLAGNLIKAGGAIDIRRGLEELQRAAGGAQLIIQNNAILGQFIDNYFAGQLVGSNLFARNTGAVINPNLELLFNGPKMRTFNYNYRFTPRDDQEAKEVRSIIKVLKKNSLPKKDPNGLFLKTPNVFKLKYVFGKNGKEEEHPYLNKIKVCALTDMNVNYTPDGNYSTYTDGSMTSYTVLLSFSELNPIYYDDFDDNSIDTPTMGY